MTVATLFTQLGMDSRFLNAGTLKVKSPIDGEALASLAEDSSSAIDQKIAAAETAFKAWRQVPAPVRGELVRQFGNRIREHKATLAELITLECGKITSEALGEVQEMIDICDFAVGLSRQLYGLTIVSERPGHRLQESWHPLGITGVISAFNFPMAVWAWNTSIALVCGNSVVWKPSEKTPLCAVACDFLLQGVLAAYPQAPKGLHQLLIGGRDCGEQLVSDRRVPLISATGSCAMGRKVGIRVAERFGRSLLELGGNNAVIVTPAADLDQALPAIVFGAAGTAGQRCTTTRRVFVHRSQHDTVVERLRHAYAQLPIGRPDAKGTLVGPLIDAHAYESMQKALTAARDRGATVVGGERVLAETYPDAYYVKPAFVVCGKAFSNAEEETFAPILYVFAYDTIEDAIERQNAVEQGLSSAIFSNDLRETERFLSAIGSDCGLANVNAGTSGAEIGGAFGGEKATGGGRESGSDAWKAYMRRSTATINFSGQLPLAQGVDFSIKSS